MPLSSTLFPTAFKLLKPIIHTPLDLSSTLVQALHGAVIDAWRAEAYKKYMHSTKYNFVSLPRPCPTLEAEH